MGARLRPSRTEQRNPRSRGLDAKSTLEILRVLNREDARVAAAVRRELPKISHAVDAIVKSFRNGARLFYVGAGTSGRLAVLDAAECPPTFGTPPKMVRAIIAGGSRAVRGAVEGAEDSAKNGARDLLKAGVKRGDAVVGLAASGSTPYVLGALQFAKKRGAATIGVTSNPKSQLASAADIAITLDTGPEAIAGSTRLKAGTAQKMVLNLLSTASMVRLGRVYEDWMIYVALTNQKLRKRGVRILQEASGASVSEAQRTLRQARHDLPAALVMLKTGANLREAQQLLKRSGGNVRQALESRRNEQPVAIRKGK
ncbi:MAG TPA: N-acetylmuramic acid 6-phosphate etherase [Candidatus Sulfotelmatobacter sp.]|nr:N-acetylmuramic acid 6-phosphate etherase [Candidatus Sulfotelmatobacter sp.]